MSKVSKIKLAIIALREELVREEQEEQERHANALGVILGYRNAIDKLKEQDVKGNGKVKVKAKSVVDEKERLKDVL